ncbi:MAG: NAD(P)-dependent oxidoreductase [Patescibacteria group bacterium]
MTPLESAPQYVGDIDGHPYPRPFRIALPDGLDNESRTLLEDHPAIEIVDDPTQAQAMVIRSVTKFPGKEKLSGKDEEKDFEDHPDLMYIVRSGDGHDNIDKPDAAKHGVATVNTPGISSRDVATQATAFILDWARHTTRGTLGLQGHEWEKKRLKPREIADMTLGIIGNGNIGTQTKTLAGPFFRKTIFYDIDPKKSDAKSFEELLEQSDVVCIHVNGKAEIMTPEMLSKMKPDSLLVNTSRGSNVNKEALLDRMNEKHGITYATDVFWGEPPDFDNPYAVKRGDKTVTDIIDHPTRFIGTPHISASRIGNQQNLGRVAVARILEFAEQGTINPDDILGHTFPAIILGEKKTEGARVMFVHDSEPGTLGVISGTYGDHNLNIEDTRTTDGMPLPQGTKAITMLDIAGDPQKINRVTQEIANGIEAVRSRVMLFRKVTGQQAVTSLSAEASLAQPDPQMEVDSHHPAPESLEPVGAH